MKTLFVSLFVFVSNSVIISAQNKIEEVNLSNGKTIIIYSDKTWEYKENSQYSRNSSSNSAPTIKHKTKSTQYKSNSRKAVNSYSTYCGAPTKKGGSCKRRVSGGGRCWQH